MNLNYLQLFALVQGGGMFRLSIIIIEFLRFAFFAICTSISTLTLKSKEDEKFSRQPYGAIAVEAAEYVVVYCALLLPSLDQ